MVQMFGTNLKEAIGHVISKILNQTYLHPNYRSWVELSWVIMVFFNIFKKKSKIPHLDSTDSQMIDNMAREPNTFFVYFIFNL